MQLSSLRNSLRTNVFLILGTVFLFWGTSQVLSQESNRRIRNEPLSGNWIFLQPNGEAAGGSFKSIDSETINWQNADGNESRELAWAKVEEVRRNISPSKDPFTDSGLGPYVLLPEGDRLRGESVALLENRGLAVQSVSIGVINIPLDQWLGAVLEVPQKPEDLLRVFQKLRKGSEKAGDLIILANRDQFQGTVLGLDGENLVIQPLGSDKEAQIKRTGVLGISIDPQSIRYKAHTGPLWNIYLTDGSRISVTNLNQTSVEGETVLATTTRWGAVWNFPMSKIDRILYIPQGQTFLDERQPDATQSVDYIGSTPTPKTGTNVNGGPLQIGLRSFDRGIGTQAKTLMAYRLTGTETRLIGWVGLDRTAEPLGKAKAVILVDGKPVFDSGDLIAGDPPKRIQIDLTNAKLLILSSEFGEGGGVCDWINWCELRLINESR